MSTMKQAKPTRTSPPFQLSSELAAAIQANDERLARLALSTDVLQRRADEIEDLKVDLGEATAAQTAIDVELGLATTDEAVAVLEAKAADATRVVDEKRAVLARIERMFAALKARHSEDANALTIAVSEFQVELQTFAGDISERVAHRIREALPPLIAVLREAWVLEQATRRGWLRSTLDAVNIPLPGHLGSVVQGERHCLGPAATVIHDGWADEPELAEMHRVARQPIDALYALQVAAEKIGQAGPPKGLPRALRQKAIEDAAAKEARAREAAEAEAERIREEDAAAAARRAAPPTHRGYTTDGIGSEASRKTAEQAWRDRSGRAPPASEFAPGGGALGPDHRANGSSEFS